MSPRVAGDEPAWSATVGLDEGYSALRDGFAALRLERDVVRVSGPDAQSYLQGQTSQDVAKLGDGGWAWALVLQPQGKLDAFVRVSRRGPDEFLLDSDAGMGPALVARLARFKLRTKVDIDQLGWQVVAVRGRVDRGWVGRSRPPRRARALPWRALQLPPAPSNGPSPSNGAGSPAMTYSALLSTCRSGPRP